MIDKKIDKLISLLELLEKDKELLKERNIEWEQQSMKNVDVSNMDAQGVMALFMGMVRGERFCDGTIMKMIKSGAVKKMAPAFKRD